MKKHDERLTDTPYETEIKLLGLDFAVLREKLKDSVAKCLGSLFERNEVYDDAEGSFKARGILVRLRTAGELSTLTLKRPADSQAESGMKVREEHETQVDNPDAVRALLHSTGLRVALRYEKIRETWVMQDVHILLDIMPFADVVEIEGDTEKVEAVIQVLQLGNAERSAASYHELQRQFRKQFGMPAGDDFTFADFNRRI